MTKKATVVEVLQLAQMYVARGWCQGAQFVGEKCCARGGVLRALEYLDPERHELAVYPGAGDFLTAAQDSTPHFVAFNDTPGRTQDEVLDLFSRAIELAEKAEAAQ